MGIVDRTKVCIVGAGPAGLMAAIHSAASKVQTVMLEANETAGRKLLLTGGGRCNFTHVAAIDELARAFGAKGSPSSVASSLRSRFGGEGLRKVEALLRRVAFDVVLLDFCVESRSGYAEKGGSLGFLPAGFG